MKNRIIELAKACGADLVGIAPASRFAADDKVFRIYPGTKSVIGLVFRCLRGSYRGIEEGSTYYQYTTMSVENLEETVMPIALVRVANLIESEGYTAVPQRRHQTIMEEKDGTNPEVAYDAITRDRPQEPQLDFVETAVRCGLGEKGFHGALLTEDFGPLQRVCFVLTDAELEPDAVKTPGFCAGCRGRARSGSADLKVRAPTAEGNAPACVAGCPGHCVDATTGAVDRWRCAAYYNGANGTKNPFMPKDAFRDFPDRLKIIAGEAEIDEEKAKRIIDAIYFYPPAQHAYDCSICGRACDVACYCELERRGVLKRKFKRPFRTREAWRFPLEDFKG